jgi:hypothetical protein
MTVRIERTAARSRGNIVRLVDGEILVQCPSGSRTPAARSLENWLRRQARTEIEKQLALVTARLRLRPRRIYVIAQRTKWGNCSAGRNLSFNWRLILAPDFVLRYLVTHEAVHLAVPDHSAKFWLTVQSLCPEMERAKQWLSANGLRIAVKLDGVCEEIDPPGRHVIPKLADPDSCCVRSTGTSIAKTYGGPMGYRRRAQARTVPRMSQCLRSLV